MGVTKSDLFTKAQNELAKTAKVFAHPARVAIIEYLIQSNTCINGDLVQELGLAQATISQHLRELKEAGLIKGTIEGVSICYCIDEGRWNEIRNLFDRLFGSFPLTDGGKCC
ncbi:ArsR/SmtB family transcription factor [Negadavirga shengliensis]|uniref:ArsR/SmtB family transcription factor n=1 Tax=Negadavirga shengliensis TaxID=1389218 RepID=A0ABV9T1C3_9BACT